MHKKTQKIIDSKLKSFDTTSPMMINQGIEWCHILYS